ncbi:MULTISPECIES: hypothetical protein [Acinetobacter]|uniref:Uncharacterized protein n=1 Tax=Acinetobacter towneri TaxID=202956 RepID=A0AAP9GV47_9GAMM|nr:MULTISPECIES: hypothetical protein [Acinetobacter]QGM27460.1 hypothetical protein GJD93_07110 [Acinetobacter towneri]QTD65108.1 hypothetical protein J4G46_04735 [Acinetobacter towneri]QTD65368.1 hypothetical protein J4G46_06280 [Acinetobacter towneri]
MNFSGDVEVFLSCLGTKESSSDILKAVILVASEFDTSETNFGGEKLSYWEFFKRGVTFRFNEHQILDTIFIYVKENEEYYPYPFLEGLIIGINHKSTKQSVVKLFGNPERESNSWLKYKILDSYLHFEFDKSSELKQITMGQF